MATTEEKKHEAADKEKKHAPPAPPPPIKKYRVLKEFVGRGGTRYQATRPPEPEPEIKDLDQLITLNDEDAKQAIEDGDVEEVIIAQPELIVPPQPVVPKYGAAPGIKTTHKS